MGTLFEDIRDGIRDGIELFVDKTEEYTKIGKLKVDILGIKRNIEKLFSELGGRTYELLSNDEKSDVAADSEVERLVQNLKEQEEKLDAKKNEIKIVKEEKEKERKERDESRRQAKEKQPESSATADQDIEDVTATEVDEEDKEK